MKGYATELHTVWEDSECAELLSFRCKCGFLNIEKHTLSNEDKIECSNCHQKYEAVWFGMQLKETK